jgi:hypothetical protein
MICCVGKTRLFFSYTVPSTALLERLIHTCHAFPLMRTRYVSKVSNFILTSSIPHAIHECPPMWQLDGSIDENNGGRVRDGTDDNDFR